MTRSLRIAKLLVASRRIELGPGLLLIEETTYKHADEGDMWQLYDKSFQGRPLVGYVATSVYPEIGHAINEIYVESRAKGKGLGEKMVRALVNVYGSFSSDPQGNTSPDAIRMWQRMGAEKVPTDQNANGYFYRLTK